MKYNRSDIRTQASSQLLKNTIPQSNFQIWCRTCKTGLNENRILLTHPKKLQWNQAGLKMAGKGWENYCGSEGEGGGSYSHRLYCAKFGLKILTPLNQVRVCRYAWGRAGGHYFIIHLSLLNLIQEQLFDHSPLWPIIQGIDLTLLHPFFCIHSLPSFFLLI